MSRTYKVTGINLKVAILGENDRLLTILTPERGLVKAVAGGARKHLSSLGGRSSLFVVNHLVIAPGRSFDHITQAETIASFPGFSQNLQRLTAGQYLAELTLHQALPQHPQPDLFTLLLEHLQRLEQVPPAQILPCLTQGIFHLLTLAGLSPQVDRCCRTGQPLIPNFEDPYWRAGFSLGSGGVVSLDWADRPGTETNQILGSQPANQTANQTRSQTLANPKKTGHGTSSQPKITPKTDQEENQSLELLIPSEEAAINPPENQWQRIPETAPEYEEPPFIVLPLRAAELAILQHLKQPDLSQLLAPPLPPPFMGLPHLRSSPPPSHLSPTAGNQSSPNSYLKVPPETLSNTSPQPLAALSPGQFLSPQFPQNQLGAKLPQDLSQDLSQDPSQNPSQNLSQNPSPWPTAELPQAPGESGATISPPQPPTLTPQPYPPLPPTPSQPDQAPEESGSPTPVDSPGCPDLPSPGDRPLPQGYPRGNHSSTVNNDRSGNLGYGLPQKNSSHPHNSSPRQNGLAPQGCQGQFFLESPPPADNFPPSAWLAVEQVLRRYAQYHLDCPIRSASLMATCFPGENVDSG